MKHLAHGALCALFALPALATAQVKVSASDAQPGLRFGSRVDLTGERAVVGGVGAYIFEDGGFGLAEVANLVPQSDVPSLNYGRAVAIDGDTAVVCDLGFGSLDVLAAAYVFVRDGSGWSEQAQLPAGGIEPFIDFGAAVAIQGDTIAVGAPFGGPNQRTGAVHLFERSGTTWQPGPVVVAFDGQEGDAFGASVALGEDLLVVGAPLDDEPTFDEGSAYVYERIGQSWVFTTKLTSGLANPQDLFGSAVALQETGGGGPIQPAVIAVGAPRASVGAPFGGSVFLFEDAGGSLFVQTGLVIGSDTQSGDAFGASVSIAQDELVVGAPFASSLALPQSGAAYRFERDLISWNETNEFEAFDAQAQDGFGSAVAVQPGRIVVGAPQQGTGGTWEGALYGFGFPQSFLSEACNGDGGDGMGCTDCPCGNNAPPGSVGGCLNSGGTGTRLIGSGSPSITAADLRFEASGAPPFNSCLLTSGNALAPANAANPCFGLNSGINAISLDGLRCVVQGVLRHGIRPSDASGDVGVTTNGWGQPNGFVAFSSFLPGSTKHFQIVHRDDAGQVCMTGQNTSQTISLTFLP